MSKTIKELKQDYKEAAATADAAHTAAYAAYRLWQDALKETEDA